jgi:hypothetical protein
MRVYKLEIDAHPLLRELDAYLRQLRPPQMFVCIPEGHPSGLQPTEMGDWRADVAAGPPDVDRPRPRAYKRMFLKVDAKPVPSMPSDAVVSACNYYPVGGAGIGWHTDTGHAGWRVYIARPLSAVGGTFFHREGSLLKAIIDEPGIALAFYVDPGHDCWHAVATEGPRFSLGIKFRSGPTARSLGLEWCANA